jgi:hypothetical protein
MSMISDAEMELGMEAEVTQPLQDLSVQHMQTSDQNQIQCQVSDQQMGQEVGLKSPPKKGHARNKHSIRAGWGSSFAGEVGIGGSSGGLQGLRKGFSMGYRSDCEKCRMKVPGHFSHVITY